MNREQIKRKAVQMIQTDGLINLTRAGLCSACNIPDGSFNHFTGCTFGEFVKELRELDIHGPEVPKVQRGRVSPELRKNHILRTAVALSIEHGYRFIKLEMVAAAAGVSAGLVSNYFTIDALRDEVMRVAVDEKIPSIIMQGIVSGNARAVAVPEDVKAQALRVVKGD